MTEYTLWGATGGNNNADDGTAVSLGTKQRTSATVPLWCVGLRYYRGTLSAGIKTGRLFRTSGSVAVSETVTFTDSGTGWQEKRFTTPVALDLDTLYTPAVHFPSGQPSFTNNYFSSGPGSAGITNGPLFAPNNTNAPGQGVYTTGASITCPTSTFNATCYWIDWIVTDVDPVGRTGTGATTATAALAATGTKAASGSGTLTATGVLTSVGRKASQGTGALTTPGTTASNGTKNSNGTGATTATAGLSAVGERVRGGSGALAATALLAATGTASRQGTGAVVATATLATVGTPARSGSAALAAVGSTASAGTAHRAGTGLLTATAVLVSSGRNSDNAPPDWDFAFGPPYTDSFALGPPHD